MRGFKRTLARSLLSRSARRSGWAALGIFLAGLFVSTRPKPQRLGRNVAQEHFNMRSGVVTTMTVKDLALKIKRDQGAIDTDAVALSRAVLDFIAQEEARDGSR